MEETQKRQVARIVRISDILSGTYVKGEGWEPNYILNGDGSRLSRLNLIATLVSIQPGMPNDSYMVDDGTGEISLRPFGEIPSLKEAGVGDILNIIGKPREYGAERYITPEIVRAVNNEGWVRVRQKELEIIGAGGRTEPAKPKENPKSEETLTEEVSEEIILPKAENSFQKIYRMIKSLDHGEGASVEEVVKSAGLHNAEEIIGELLKEGEIFEIKSGRLKILE